MLIIKAAESFQRVLILIIEGDDYISDFCGRLFQDDNEISLRDTGIFHRITFGAEDIKVSFSEKIGREINIFLYILFFRLSFAAGDATNDSSTSSIHGSAIEFFSINRAAIIFKKAVLVHFNKIAIYG